MTHQNVEQGAGKRVQDYIYNFNDLIGKGNFSKVYKTFKDNDGQPKAIKVVELNSLKSKKLEQLLLSEIKVLKKLDHENVVKCYEVLTSSRNCYIITELCNEGDLDSFLKKKKIFTELEAESIVRDIVKGLLYLHSLNIIHRDLKCANVFIHNGVAKIADFGFVKVSKQKFKDLSIGSPAYMSPQGLINNIYGPKTDIWSFGVMLYQFFHGELPTVKCKCQKQLKDKVTSQIKLQELKSNIMPEIKQVIIACMEVQQQKRPNILQLSQMPYIRRLLNGTTLSLNFNDIKQLSYTILPDLRNSQKDSNFSFVQLKKNTQQHQIKFNQFIDQNIYLISTNEALNNKTPKKNLTYKYINQTPINLKKQISGQVRNHCKSPLNIQINERTLSPKIISPRKTFNTIETNSQCIILGKVSFKQCINILHYCRVIYKYLAVLIESPYSDGHKISTIAGYLFAVLKQLNLKAQSQNIQYDKQKIEAQKYKLKQVIEEYRNKYKKELQFYLVKNSGIQNPPGLMKAYFQSIWFNLDEKINLQCAQQTIIMGQLMLVILDFKTKIISCLNNQDYSPIDNYQHVEAVLKMIKNGTNFEDYNTLKLAIMRQNF